LEGPSSGSLPPQKKRPSGGGGGVIIQKRVFPQGGKTGIKIERLNWEGEKGPFSKKGGRYR